MKFLNSDNSGVSNHSESDGLKIATLYSWITEIREKADPIQAWITIGSPCYNDHESYTYF
ncbi:MAG: hypothetical protein ACFFDN_40280 [Candidatus Hodarchaeota archaeon]